MVLCVDYAVFVSIPERGLGLVNRIIGHVLLEFLFHVFWAFGLRRLCEMVCVPSILLVFSARSVASQKRGNAHWTRIKG